MERHGFWMPKLRVVEAWICKGGGGFGRGVVLFVGFGLPRGGGVVFVPWVPRFLQRQMRGILRWFWVWD